MYIKAPNEISAEPAQCHEDTATNWSVKYLRIFENIEKHTESETLRIKGRTMWYWEIDRQYLFSSIHSIVTHILNRGFQNTRNWTNSSFSTAVQVRLLLYHPMTPWWSRGSVWEKWQFREQTYTTQEFLSDAVIHLYLCSMTAFFFVVPHPSQAEETREQQQICPSNRRLIIKDYVQLKRSLLARTKG